jgi:hypothetical protein
MAIKKKSLNNKRRLTKRRNKRGGTKKRIMKRRRKTGGSLISIEPTDIVSSFGTNMGAKTPAIISGDIPNISSNILNQPINNKYNVV